MKKAFSVAKTVLEDEKYGTDVIATLSDVQLVQLNGKKSVGDVRELGRPAGPWSGEVQV